MSRTYYHTPGQPGPRTLEAFRISGKYSGDLRGTVNCKFKLRLAQLNPCVCRIPILSRGVVRLGARRPDVGKRNLGPSSSGTPVPPTPCMNGYSPVRGPFKAAGTVSKCSSV